MIGNNQDASAPEQTIPVDAVIAKDGRPITTSLKIANVFGKQHKDVLKAIKNLDCSEYFRERNFAPAFREVPGPNGAVRQERYLEVTRDGFTFLVMGFTGAQAARYKEAYIARFNALEAQLKALPAMPTILISCNNPPQIATDTHLSTAILNLTAAVEHLTGQLAQIARIQPAFQQVAAKPEESAPVLQFLTAWWHCLSTREVTAADLCRIIEGQQCPVFTQAAARLFDSKPALSSRRLGATLRTWSHQTFAGFHVLNKGKAKNSVLWRLERTQ